MNILICESKRELVGEHIARLQKVFYPSTFDYAEDGLKAMEKIDSNGYSYDLILSDDDLQEITGLELYRHIRKAGVEVPFILCCDQRKKSELEEIEDEDFFYLTKMYNFTDLKTVVDTMTSEFY